jgi:hypothetical protein
MTYITTEQEREAYELGVTAAKNAASWAYDGNMSQRDIELRIKGLDEGDPAVWDLLPNEPNLSGEWADAPTPLSVARAILGTDIDDQELYDAEPELADAWERGVADTFADECERVVRAAL